MKKIIKKIFLITLILNLLHFMGALFQLFTWNFPFSKSKNLYHTNVVYADNSSDNNISSVNNLEKKRNEVQEFIGKNDVLKGFIKNERLYIESENKYNHNSNENNDSEVLEKQYSEILQIAKKKLLNMLNEKFQTGSEKQQQIAQIKEENEAINSKRKELEKFIKKNPKFKNLMENYQDYKTAEEKYKKQEEEYYNIQFELLKPNNSNFLGRIWQSVTEFTQQFVQIVKTVTGTNEEDLKSQYPKILENATKYVQNLEEINEIRTKLKEIEPETLTNLQKQNWEKYESKYSEIEKLEKEYKFKELLELLFPSKGYIQQKIEWFGTLFNTSNSPQNLKEAYQSILDDTYIETIKQEGQDLQKPNADKKNILSSIINKIWPSVNAVETVNSSTLPDNDRLPAFENFFNKHPFFTKALGWALGEKSSDIKEIAKHLATKLGDHLKKEVSKEAEKAKTGVTETATNGVKGMLTKIVIIVVASTTLFITIIYWLKIKMSKKNKMALNKIKNSNKSKTPKK